MLIDLLDRALTRLFATKLVIWIAVHVLHIPAEKCSLCYTRVRFAQLMLWCTSRLDGIEWLHRKRVNWRVRVNHARAEASPAAIQVAAYAPPTDTPAPIPIPPHYLDMPRLPRPLWWPRTSEEEHAAAVRELGSRAEYGEW